MSYLYNFLGWIMNGCYNICKNYGVAIILFTLISKIILLPVSIWTHLNSIKMIKMQPDINFLKARYYGQKDIIEEEQAKLFKKEKYSPLASTTPLFIQLVLLMGVVGVIKLGIADSSINMMMGNINLALVPSENGLLLLYSPIVAGLSSWILCITQNASNVLQSEQTKANKYGMMIFSVALSLYLGWFVPIGTAWYWVWSNILAIVQMYILNACIKPSKYVDYERLEASRKELAKLNSIGKDKKAKISKEDKKREKADYKRFFNVVNKHLVFYSESSGFYKYYKGIIEYLLENTNITIHYITSDPKDQIFEIEKTESKIRAYYIGENKLITLMMKMDADIVVMTMPDLENYHIKRSYVRDDIEYVYIPHGMDSINLTMRKGSVDHFDAVLCTGQNQINEIRKTEEVYKLAKKQLVECGYPLLDEMISDYEKSHLSKDSKEQRTVMIAPSWQTDNIVDSCLEELLTALKDTGYEIVVRPHPQHVRHRKEQMEELKMKFETDKNITIQTDFSSNSSVFDADLMITDWSAIAYEYAFTTKKPVMFINTPMKIMNPEYEKIGIVPLNVSLREQIGKSLNLEELSSAGETAKYLIEQSANYKEIITNYTNEQVFNIGTSSVVAAKYIAHQLIEKKKSKK